MFDIEKYRKYKHLWDEFACKIVTADDTYKDDYDINAKARYAALIALQYDWRREDEDLVRYLFEQEIIANEHDRCYTVGEAIYLAAYLLARYRTPSDIALFYRAKFSNFDLAAGGFDREFMFYALRDRTFEYARDNYPDIYDEIKYDIGAKTTETLDEWWQRLVRRYPERVDDESPYTLFERSLCFGDNDTAREYLEGWAASEPETLDKVRTLKHAYRNLGDYTKAIEMAYIILESKKTLWDRSSGLIELLKLNCLANNFPGGLKIVEQLDQLFSQFDDWKDIGLGRMAMHEGFELSLASDNLDVACKIFWIVHSWAEKFSQIPFAGLTAAWNAAERCGYDTEARMYKQMADRECERIDKLL